MICSRQCWQGSQEFSCTRGRREPGTGQGSSQTTSKNWDPRSGNLGASRCWGRQMAQNCTSLGSNTDSPRSAVHLAASAPKREPSGEPHSQRFFSILPRARRGHVGSSCRQFRCGWAVLDCGLGRCLAHDQPAHTRRGHDVLHRLSLEEPIGGCLGELRDASSELDRKGL